MLDELWSRRWPHPIGDGPIVFLLRCCCPFRADECAAEHHVTTIIPVVEDETKSIASTDACIESIGPQVSKRLNYFLYDLHLFSTIAQPI
jgi:hypothetical protein